MLPESSAEVAGKRNACLSVSLSTTAPVIFLNLLPLTAPLFAMLVSAPGPSPKLLWLLSWLRDTKEVVGRDVGRFRLWAIRSLNCLGLQSKGLRSALLMPHTYGGHGHIYGCRG